MKFLKRLFSAFRILSGNNFSYATDTDLKSLRHSWGLEDDGTASGKSKDELIDGGGNVVVTEEEKELNTPKTNPNDPPKKTDEELKAEEDAKQAVEAKAKEEEGKNKGKESEGETTYEVAGKTLTEEEFTSIVDKLKEQYGEEEIGKLPEKVLLGMVEDKVNLLEGSKSLNKGHQQNAREKKLLNEQKEMLEKSQAEFDEEKRSYESQIKSKLEELEDRNKEIDEKIKANQKILDKSTEKIYDDDEREELRLDKKLAQRENEELEAEKKSIATNIDTVKGNNELADTHWNIQTLQRSFKELQTAEPVVVILERYIAEKKANAGFSMDMNEVTKASRVYDIINAFYDQTIDTNIVDYYNRVKLNLPAMSTAQPVSDKKTVNQVKSDSVRKQIQDLINKQKKPGSPNGLGSGTSTASHDQTEKHNPEKYRKQTGWNNTPA